MQVSRALEQRLANLRPRYLCFRAWRFRLHRKNALLGLKSGIRGWGYFAPRLCKQPANMLGHRKTFLNPSGVEP